MNHFESRGLHELRDNRLAEGEQVFIFIIHVLNYSSITLLLYDTRWIYYISNSTFNQDNICIVYIPFSPNLFFYILNVTKICLNRYRDLLGFFVFLFTVVNIFI